MFGVGANSLDVLDDIAEIDHMFCDKTGTLTKNEMTVMAAMAGENVVIGDKN